MSSEGTLLPVGGPFERAALIRDDLLCTVSMPSQRLAVGFVCTSNVYSSVSITELYLAQ